MMSCIEDAFKVHTRQHPCATLRDCHLCKFNASTAVSLRNLHLSAVKRRHIPEELIS
jgi:hypothetical protein